MNKSVKLEPGTTEWNETCYRDYTWSMLNCNGEFLEKDCSSAEIATVRVKKKTSHKRTVQRGARSRSSPVQLPFKPRSL